MKRKKKSWTGWLENHYDPEDVFCEVTNDTIDWGCFLFKRKPKDKNYRKVRLTVETL